MKLSHWAPDGQRERPRVRRLRPLLRRPARHRCDRRLHRGLQGRPHADAGGRPRGAAGVPIVCVKVGRTDEGASMAKSHTGHLTGSDRVTSDVFRQFGVTRVDGLDELTDVVRRAGAPPAARAAGPSQRLRVRDLRRHRRPHGRPGRRRRPQAPRLAPETCRRAARAHPRLPAGEQPGRLRWRALHRSGHRAGDPDGDPGRPEHRPPDRADHRRARRDVAPALPSTWSPAAETSDVPIIVVWGSPTEGPAFNEVLASSSRLVTVRTFHNCVLAANVVLRPPRVRRPLPVAVRAGRRRAVRAPRPRSSSSCRQAGRCRSTSPSRCSAPTACRSPATCCAPAPTWPRRPHGASRARS